MLKKTFINFKNKIPYFFIIKDIIILFFLIWIIKLLPIDFTYNNIISVVFGFNELQSFFLTLGAGLIGSTAIIFSILLFTVQSNSDSLPTGLLKDYLKEKEFINSFVYSLIIAILIACLSLNKEQHLLIYFVLIFLFLIYRLITIYKTSYYKAIDVITPEYHLKFNFQNNVIQKIKVHNKKIKKEKDTFQISLNLKNKIINGINYCIFFTEKYISKKDYDIVKAAYISIVNINAEYLNSIQIQNNDPIINYTLEALRKNFVTAISNKDERLISIILNIFSALNLNYSHKKLFAESNLANHYLIEALRNCVELNMPDILMEGIRLLSLTTQKEIQDNNSTDITQSINLITELSLVGIQNKKYAPITNIALEALAIINNQILYSKDSINDRDYNIDILIKSLQKVISAEINHEIYYENFTDKLNVLTNAIIQDSSDNKDILNIINNINNYFDKLRQVLKDLFRESLKINSKSTIFLIIFIENIIYSLITLLDYHNMNENQKDDLKNMINGFIGIFSFLQDIKSNLREYNWIIPKTINTLFNLSKSSLNDADISNKIKECFLSLAFHFINKEEGEDSFASAIGAYIYIDIRTSGNIDNSLVLINKNLKQYVFSKEKNSQLLKSLNNNSFQSNIENELQIIEEQKLVIKYINSISELIENK